MNTKKYVPNNTVNKNNKMWNTIDFSQIYIPKIRNMDFPNILSVFSNELSFRDLWLKYLKKNNLYKSKDDFYKYYMKHILDNKNET